MENYKDRIQDYIDGVLGGEELQSFEEQLLIDAELKNLVSLQKEVQDIINKRENSSEASLRQSLHSAKLNMSSASGSKGYKLYLPIAVAASLLVFFMLYFFNLKDQGLYDLPTMQSEVVRGQEENVKYEQAVKAYNAKSYGVARGILEDLILKEPTVIQYQYYTALTFVGEENWEKSILQLKPIAEGHSVFSDEAKYFLAVSYQHKGDDNKALEVLNDIPDNGSLGKKKEDLLNKLK